MQGIPTRNLNTQAINDRRSSMEHLNLFKFSRNYLQIRNLMFFTTFCKNEFPTLENFS